MFYVCISILCFNSFSYISQISDNGAFGNGIQQANSLKNYGSVICCFIQSYFYGNVYRKIQNLVKCYIRNHCTALSEVYYPLQKVSKYVFRQTIQSDNVLSNKILRQVKWFFFIARASSVLKNSFRLKYWK